MNSHCFRLPKYKLVRQFGLNACEYQKTNHYDSLEVTPKATQGDIKSAYYKLSKQYHPDLNKNDAAAAEHFKDISAAYEVLGNLKNRKLYDRSLLVGTREEIYKSDEPEVENYQHASFHKHRNKPSSHRSTAKFTQYDIDEWTKAHYSDTFTSAFKFKRGINLNVNEKKHTKDEHDSALHTFLFVLLLAGCGLAFENSRSNFDKPVPTDEKPD